MLDIMNNNQRNANDSEGDPESNPKIYTPTSDRKERKVTDTSNGYLKQKLLSNRTLPIIVMTMDPKIDDRIATCGESPHNMAITLTTEVISDAARRSAQVLWTPRHASRTVRDGTTPDN